MSDKDQIKELFSQKMGAYEAKVNPELWTNIASQVGATSSVAASAGMSLFTKAIIGISAASILTASVVIISSSNDKVSEKEKTAPLSVNVKPESVSTTTPSDLVSPQVSTYTSTQSGSTSNSNPSIGGENGTLVTPVQAEQNNPTNHEYNPSPTTPPFIKPMITPAEVDPKPSEIKGVQVPVEQDPIIEVPEEKFTIELPNVITPNNDGANDFLTLRVEDASSFYIKVLDQNDKMVFESHDPNFKWDGRNMYTGEPVLKGIHMYYVIAENSQGKVFKGQEYLMVIRD